jgi:spore coat polysaccharide biosynthesis protein SpsF
MLLNYIDIIIQARMGSKRFPGKSMHEFNDIPSLKHLTNSLLQLIPKEQIIIATSENIDNNAIREFAKIENINLYSGDENNVASRFYTILKHRPCKYFVRLNGDSPLFDYRILEEEISALNDKFDIVSTIATERFPSGMNFEILKSEVFKDYYNNFTTSDHFEHVTKYFYDHKDQFAIKQVENKIDNAKNYNFSFDTKEDLERLKKLFDSFDTEHCNYSLVEKCKIYDKLFRQKT